MRRSGLLRHAGRPKPLLPKGTCTHPTLGQTLQRDLKSLCITSGRHRVKAPLSATLPHLGRAPTGHGQEGTGSDTRVAGDDRCRPFTPDFYRRGVPVRGPGRLVGSGTGKNLPPLDLDQPKDRKSTIFTDRRTDGTSSVSTNLQVTARKYVSQNGSTIEGRGEGPTSETGHRSPKRVMSSHGRGSYAEETVIVGTRPAGVSSDATMPESGAEGVTLEGVGGTEGVTLQSLRVLGPWGVQGFTLTSSTSLSSSPAPHSVVGDTTLKVWPRHVSFVFEG